MTLDPKLFLNNNYDMVVKRCQDNWIESPEDTKRSLLDIVAQLEAFRLDDTQTCDLIEKCLAKLDPTAARVHIDLLFRAIEGNPSFVYATNYLIRRMNRLDSTNIELRDGRYLKKLMEVFMIQHISLVDDFVVSSFPSPYERYKFLLLLHHEVSKGKGSPLTVGIVVSSARLVKRVQSLLNLTSKKIDEYIQGSKTSNEPTAKQKALLIYYRYGKLRHTMPSLLAVIEEAFTKEGWIIGSYKHVRNLYNARKTGKKDDPLNENNIKAILSLLNENERGEALSDLK